MQYSVKLPKAAQKQLEEVPDRHYLALWRKMIGLGQDPRPPGVKKLAGSNLWRIRAGRYRVIYAINDFERVVIVVRVAAAARARTEGCRHKLGLLLCLQDHHRIRSAAAMTRNLLS